AVQINQGRHDGFAREVDLYSSRRHAQLATAADLSKRVADDYEGGVLDWRAAVSHDQTCALKHSLTGLAVQLPRPRRSQQQKRRSEKKRRPHAVHGISSGKHTSPPICGGEFGGLRSEILVRGLRGKHSRGVSL